MDLIDSGYGMDGTITPFHLISESYKVTGLVQPPIFDPVIDEQCLHLYDSKELRAMEEASNYSGFQNTIGMGTGNNFYNSQQSKFRNTPQF